MAIELKKTSFLELDEEARINFEAGRFSNAANILDKLRNKLLEEYMFEDYFYFAYRHLVALERNGDKKKMINTLFEVSVTLNEWAIKLGLELISSSNPSDTNKQLEIAKLIQRSAHMAQKDELQEKIVKTMYTTLKKQLDLGGKDAITILETINQLPKFDFINTDELNQRMAHHYLDQANKIETYIPKYKDGKVLPIPYDKSGINELKVDHLLHAASIFRSIDPNSVELGEILSQVHEIHAAKNYRKYDFPEFTSKEDISEYLSSINLKND